MPFTMDNGKLVTVFAGKPAGQNTAAPAGANGGTLDLSDLTIDLTQDPARLNAPDNKLLVKGMSVNPLFSKTILANWVDNPLFTGDNASGILDATLIRCDQLPLGGLVTQAVPANAGKADMKFSLTKLTIGLGGIQGLQQILKEARISANVTDATVSVARGFSTQHISFVTGKYSMDFDGNVRLSDQMFMPLTWSVGPLTPFVKLVPGLSGPNGLLAIPDRFALPLTGTVTTAHLNAQSFAKGIADVVAKGAAKGLIDGATKGKNPLGGLLDQLNKKK